MRILTTRKPLRAWLLLTLCTGLQSFSSAFAQDNSGQPLHLEGLTLNGLHTFLTDSWVTVEVIVTNPNAEGRDGRVVVFYADRPDAQYARDIWVPGRSTMSTWMLVGPAPEREPGVMNQESGGQGQKSEVRVQKSEIRNQNPDERGQEFSGKAPRAGVRSGGLRVRNQDSKSAQPPALRPSQLELQALIYERTGDQERLLLPNTEERVRSRLATYQPREPVTVLFMDTPRPSVFSGREVRVKPPESEDVLDLVRAFRGAQALTEHVRLLQDDFLPPTADGFDGVDHIVLAGRRLSDDPCGRVALARWLEQGGRLWVMLDRADADGIAAILGGHLGFHVVDRTSLTRVQIENCGFGPIDLESAVREFEKPVEFVRVDVGPEFTVLHKVNGWPASFTRKIGRGQVFITALGAAAWCRPRTDHESQSPFDTIPDLPVLMPAMEYLSQQLQPSVTALFPGLSRPSSGGQESRESNVFAPLVLGDIGYSVVSVSAASILFGGFVIVMLVLGIALRKWGRLELLGWVGPVAALSTGAAFMVLGEVSRRAVMPTVAVAEWIAVNPGTSELSVSGLLGHYTPSSGPANIRTHRGGILELDMSGLEGQTRRLVQTDTDHWHWENLTLPTGVRLGSFRSVARTDEPISCVARFGPRGLEGRLSARGLHGLADVLVRAPSGRVFSLRLSPDGTFAIGENDLLPPGQFVAGTVLSDRQQQRQAIFRRLLNNPRFSSTLDDCLVFAWTDRLEVPFEFDSQPRLTGSALISCPLEFEHSLSDARVTVPRGFIPYRRILETGRTRPTLDGQAAIDQHFRFQLPQSILPLKVESAQMFAKVEAPARRFTVSSRSRDGRVELRSVANPIDPLTVEIVRDDLLVLDGQGGLHLDIAVGDAATVGDEPTPKWNIDNLELEVVGKTLPRR